MRNYTYNGDYPEPTKNVFISYLGEPCVGYFMPTYNEDISQGGTFYFRNPCGTEVEASDEDIDYWIDI